jgi:hypothetical protein
MLEELVYSAAQRTLDQQSTSLSDLRTRTSTLVAAEVILWAIHLPTLWYDFFVVIPTEMI